MRHTSVEAYQKIRNEGLLSKARLEVYCVLYDHGPLTAGEVFVKCQRRNAGHTVVKGSVCARLTELNRQGVVAEVGERTCGLTGHNAILWDVTPDLPRSLVKPKKRGADALEVANKRLLIAVKGLEDALDCASYATAQLVIKSALRAVEEVGPDVSTVED